MATGGEPQRKPQLQGRIDFLDTVNAAILLPKDDGIISIANDRTLKVWLMRDSGKYWPSVCEKLAANATCLHLDSETLKLLVGLDNGVIIEYTAETDFNRLSQNREYPAHSSSVTDLRLSVSNDWVLSVARDMFFQWHCGQTGQRLGGYKGAAAYLCMAFDAASDHAFLGDYAGVITMVKVEQNSCNIVTTLTGHSGSVRSLEWVPDGGTLYSAGFDQLILVWDIGGGKGVFYELTGHSQKVNSVVYLHRRRLLFSSGDDGILMGWDMSTKRSPAPAWNESKTCEICEVPFFWNVKDMYQKKLVGVRQHHCRKCGRAVCDKCSSTCSALPLLGFECSVRVCDLCGPDITEVDRRPLAVQHNMLHGVKQMDYNPDTEVLLTVGADRCVKIWRIS